MPNPGGSEFDGEGETFKQAAELGNVGEGVWIASILIVWMCALAHEALACTVSPKHMRWTTAGVMRLAFIMVSNVAT
jgi:hypothetical protein